MTSNSSATPSAVARILYKEVVPGDLRKIEAESNDSNTGGGARDFRFGEFKKLEAIIRQMFPRIIHQQRRRGGRTTDVEVFGGKFFWNFNGKDESKDVIFEPPTDVRPNEGRVTRVHEQVCFALDRIPGAKNGSKVLLLLVQRADGSVWPYFIESASLSEPGRWDPRVSSELLKCINAFRPTNRVVIGFCDFETGNRYCNGK